VPAVANLAVTGGVVGGATPNATLTIGGSSGLNVNAVNLNVNGDPGFAQSAYVATTYDKMVSAAGGFCNVDGMDILHTVNYGQNQYGADVGGTNTLAKVTMTGLAITGNYKGAGQHFGTTIQNNTYGMSDAFVFNWGLTFAGGPINGDEGQAFTPASFMQQLGRLSWAHITSVHATTLSTTTTQAIVASKDPQTIKVASVTGAAVNDWIVFAQAPPTGAPNICAAQITAINSAGTPTPNITCVCPNNFSNGTTITPALVLGVDSDPYFGQDRVMVNLSSSSFNSGTIQYSGNHFVGTGTGWANNMVGGTVNNIGAMSVDADTYAQAPFSDGYSLPLTTNTQSLRSWYQIQSVTATTMYVQSQTVAAFGYFGRAPVAPAAGGTYIVRPAARLLIQPSSGVIVCETSNVAQWAVGHQVECAICPYPDIHGFDFRIGQWTPGGIRRSFMALSNTGARTIDTGINFGTASGTTIGASGCDTYAFDKGLSIGMTRVGIYQSLMADSNPQAAAWLIVDNINNSTTDGSSRFYWQTPSGNFYFGKNSANNGLAFHLCSADESLGRLFGISESTGINPLNWPELEWGGWLRIDGKANTINSMLEFGALGQDNYSSNTFVRILPVATLPATSYFKSGNGFDFEVLTGGVHYPLFSMGTTSYVSLGPYIATPPSSVATSSANTTSINFSMTSSVWNGSTAQFRPAILYSSPGVGTNAAVSFAVNFLYGPQSYSMTYPVQSFTVDENGVMFFGQQPGNPAAGGIVSVHGATLDPSSMTAIRTIKMPDIGGGNLVVAAGAAPASSTAAGTAGAAIMNSNNLYVCVASGNWVKFTGATF
jgi:hypothetical protein